MVCIILPVFWVTMVLKKLLSTVDRIVCPNVVYLLYELRKRYLLFVYHECICKGQQAFKKQLQQETGITLSTFVMIKHTLYSLVSFRELTYFV